MTTTRVAQHPAGESRARATGSDGQIRRQVFVEPGVLTVVEPSPDRRGPGRRVLGPGVHEALRLLLDNHRVTLIADEPAEDVPELADLPRMDAVPDSIESGSWYVTSEPTWCEGERPSGLRSILVGPRRPPTNRPTLRCDLEARDLNAAVMEILVRETMS